MEIHYQGHTTQTSSGIGIGLVLYDPSNSEELWSGRIYASGDRTGFEAEYTSIIIALDFAKQLGLKSLVSFSEVAVICSH